MSDFAQCPEAHQVQLMIKMYKYHELALPVIFRQPARLWLLFSSVSAALAGPHTFWHIQKCHRSFQSTILIAPRVNASRMRILAPGSIDSFAADLLDQPMPRLIF
jgi:hypothetical protein